MNKKVFLIILFCIYSLANIKAQKIITFEVEVAKTAYGLDVPASIDLKTITILPKKSLSMFEISGDNKIHVPFQINDEEQRTLHWLIKSSDDSSTKHIYKLVNSPVDQHAEFIGTEIKDGQIIIRTNDRKFLGYQYETLYPPIGIDSVYKRSGFIHPLWSPHGQILTQIQPNDHYHHYGIWNPWTHVLFESDTVDFWNLAKREGTIKFTEFISISEGPVYSEFQVLHQHIVFKKDGIEKVALNELQSVRIYKPDNSDYYIVDITIELSCASKSSVLLLKYRYGGFSWRATEQWHKDNSEVLSSEGKTRKNVDGTNARWCIVQGELDNDYGGIVMMSYPTNYNHPEPLRIWPENQNGRGDMFANFSPTKNKDWQLVPGKTYVLKYRLIVFNGHYSKEGAERAWLNYANIPKIRIEM